ncbi:MAG: glucokinase [Xanthobacteraceae bacterium]|nr:glucokinase [Xanthobacteraceae bacterium]
MTLEPFYSTTARSLSGTEDERVLLGDIGGTNARFALFAGGALGPVEHYPVAAYANIAAAIAAFLARQAQPETITSAVLGVAGPVEEGRTELVNSGWVIDAAALRTGLGFTRVALINDFEAIAWALLKFTPDHLKSIGGGHAQPGRVMVALGPGTGLGLAAMIPGEPNRVIATEGGHANLAASSEREDAVIAQIRRKIGRVSVERAISGPGLQNLYSAIAELDHAEVPPRSAAEISQSAIEGSCPVSKAALDMFCAVLGTVAGDAALLFRARGGVYLAGGILPRIIDYVAQSEFRARFEAKGRMRGYLETIPTSIILHTDPAFLGLIAAIESERAAPPIQA